jgi:hypothetical protein
MILTSKYIEDENGEKYAPITTPNAVRWLDGSNLSDKLEDVEQDIEDVKIPADQLAFALTKVLTVDFLQNQDTVQWTNMYGNVTIVAAAGINVATLKISHGSVLEQLVTLGTTDIDILDGEVVTLKITRTTDSQDAVATLKMVKTAAE